MLSDDSSIDDSDGKVVITDGPPKNITHVAPPVFFGNEDEEKEEERRVKEQLEADKAMRFNSLKLPRNWAYAKDDFGRVYFFHKKAKQPTWIHPRHGVPA